MVYGIKPDHREGFILSISKDLLVISFSGKNSHAFYSGRDISDTFSPADIYILDVRIQIITEIVFTWGEYPFINRKQMAGPTKTTF